MPAERITMRKIREVFRLKFDCDISSRQIAKSCNIARSTISLKQPVNPAPFILIKFQQKFSFVAPMGNMPYVAGQMMSVCAGH